MKKKLSPTIDAVGARCTDRVSMLVSVKPLKLKQQITEMFGR